MYNQNENVPFVWTNAAHQRNGETYHPDDEAASPSTSYNQPYMPSGAYEEYSRYGTGTEATQPNMQDPERQPIVNYPMVSNTCMIYCKCFVILTSCVNASKESTSSKLGSLQISFWYTALYCGLSIIIPPPRLWS
jgi:hypothetical protein